MKKLFLTLLVAVSALSASAQVYLGGEVGLWRNSDAKTTNFTIKPEIGYGLNDKWALGLVLGYQHDYKSVELLGLKATNKVNSFIVNPYARYTAAQFGPVSVFLDGGFGFATSKASGADDSVNSWQVGIKPGVAVNLTKRLSFVTHVGFLGYQDGGKGTTENAFGENGFGFNLSGNNLTFGLYYNF
ncbi:MAG: outer membrane beta-barrel protein [Alloprevotella sp.]|nr:outer membrane beta-barrel protein [Bacteroidales bacterium]MDY3943388.1 outer membrane beta-barrel protein [Alloprevotella sp.]